MQGEADVRTDAPGGRDFIISDWFKLKGHPAKQLGKAVRIRRRSGQLPVSLLHSIILPRCITGVCTTDGIMDRSVV